MNKSELRKYLIGEVKRLIQKGQLDMAAFGCAILDLEQLADNIISKIPDETIIATGKVLPSAYGMLIGDKTMHEVNNKIAMYWNKNIEIVVKEATSQK